MMGKFSCRGFDAMRGLLLVLMLLVGAPASAQESEPVSPDRQIIELGAIIQQARHGG